MLMCLWNSLQAQERLFDECFQDATLRLDYAFAGNDSHQEIYLRQAYLTSAWAGRRTNLSQPLLDGNGQIRVLDPVTGDCLYANSFSSLFQEWTATEEASRVQMAFENSFQVGVYEGGGYQSKGVYRPVQECRMKINECERFCPVCSRAIERMIDYYTGR